MAYPSEVDAVEATPAGSASLGESDPTHTEHHTQLRAAVQSIAAVLGDDPENGYATVQAAIAAALVVEGSGPLSINAQSGTSYTLVIGDAEGMVRINNSSANTVTIPPNSSVAFPEGTTVLISQAGTGATTIQAGSGVTLVYEDAVTNVLADQYATAGAVKVATDTWQLFGALAAA